MLTKNAAFGLLVHNNREKVCERSKQHGGVVNDSHLNRERLRDHSQAPTQQDEDPINMVRT